MARHGDGIYQRGKTWWLDFTHRGERHVVRLGKNISRTVAGELARVQRGAILKGEAGIGGPKLKDPHTFASKLAMAGVDPATIQELGGWRSLVMVQRYTHLTPAHKAAAVERIASAEFPNA